MDTLVLILASIFLVSLVSLIGILILLLEKILSGALTVLVGLATGGLLGGAFLHLLPEALSQNSSADIFICVIMGILLFFSLEKFLCWHHCHRERCDVHTFTYMSLVGDAVHNFIDGMIIAVSYGSGISLGVASTIAIVFHEIPQEIGDFGVLIYGGTKRLRALFYNFLSALTAIAGGLVSYSLSFSVENFAAFLVPFAAGGFIYIATSDLIPELHKERRLTYSSVQMLLTLIGVLLMWLLKSMFG